VQFDGHIRAFVWSTGGFARSPAGVPTNGGSWKRSSRPDTVGGRRDRALLLTFVLTGPTGGRAVTKFEQRTVSGGHAALGFRRSAERPHALEIDPATIGTAVGLVERQSA
jgi:hypothetical protein